MPFLTSTTSRKDNRALIPFMNTTKIQLIALLAARISNSTILISPLFRKNNLKNFDEYSFRLSETQILFFYAITKKIKKIQFFGTLSLRLEQIMFTAEHRF